jgi:hypothetical protein
MKLPTHIKRIAAASSQFKTKAERTAYMRVMGTAIHEAAYKIRQAAKMTKSTPTVVRPSTEEVTNEVVADSVSA